MQIALPLSELCRYLTSSWFWCTAVACGSFHDITVMFDEDTNIFNYCIYYIYSDYLTMWMKRLRSEYKDIQFIVPGLKLNNYDRYCTNSYLTYFKYIICNFILYRLDYCIIKQGFATTNEYSIIFEEGIFSDKNYLHGHYINEIFIWATSSLFSIFNHLTTYGS